MVTIIIESCYKAYITNNGNNMGIYMLLHD
jgi:hypothetical protein